MADNRKTVLGLNADQYKTAGLDLLDAAVGGLSAVGGTVKEAVSAGALATNLRDAVSATDEQAIAGLFNVMRNYGEILLFNDAYYDFFGEDYYTQHAQDSIVKEMPNIPDARTAQAFLGPQGPSPYYEKDRIQGGSPMDADNGIIAAGTEDEVQSGTYFRSTYVDFKKIGYITALNPRYQPQFRLVKSDAVFSGNAKNFFKETKWKWDKAKYKLAWWNLDEEQGAEDFDSHCPNPVTVPGDGRVMFRYELDFTTTGQKLSNDTTQVLEEKDGCYFISPSILNAIARRGIHFRDLGKSSDPNAASYAARSALYTNLYASLMKLLWFIAGYEKGYADSPYGGQDEGVDMKYQFLQNALAYGGNRGWILNHPNATSVEDSHSYLLAAKFIQDPDTTMEMVDNPTKHPDSKYHWLDPKYADGHGQKWQNTLIFKGLKNAGRSLTPPGIMNQSQVTYVLAGTKDTGTGNKLLELLKRMLSNGTPFLSETHDAILALMRSEMGYVGLEGVDPAEEKYALLEGSQRTATVDFQEPVFANLKDYKERLGKRTNDIFQVFGAAAGTNAAAEAGDAESVAQVNAQTKGDLARDAAKEAGRNRRALTPTDMQCYLLENIRRLSSREGALASKYRHCSKLWTDSNPALVMNILHHKLTSDEAEAFVNICPEIQAALVPYFKIYRVDYNKQGKPLGKDKEFRIPNFVDEEDITEMMTAGYTGRLPGAGMKSFTWNLDGTQPATVDNNISAELKMYFQTVDDFFKGAALDDDENDQAGRNNPSFLDLVIASPGATTEDLSSNEDDPGEDPGTEVPENKTRIESELSRRYDGARFRIKVVAGWSTPPYLADIFPDMDMETARMLTAAIQRQKTTLFLQQTRHDVDFRQDGSIMLTVNYQAALTGILTAQTANIFSPSYLGAAQLEEKKQEIKEARTSALTLDSEKKALTEKLEEFNRLQKQDKLIRYRKLLEGLFCSGKIYNLAIPRTDLLLPPLASLDPQERANRAKQRQNRQLRISQGADTSVLLDAISDEINGTGTPAAAATKTSEILTTKYDNLGPGGRAKSIIYASYFYLGDLIDNVIAQIKLNNNGEGLDIPFILSQVPMIDPLQAYKINNIEEILNHTQDLANAQFLEALYKSDPFNFSKHNPVSSLMNIGDIPISVDAFQVWFKDKVVKPGRTNYYLLHFVKDICADLITGALQSPCFEDLNFVQRFDCQPLALKSAAPASAAGSKITPNATIPLGGRNGLASMTVNVDDSTDTSKIQLGMVLISTDVKPKALLGMKSYKEDIAQGVYHHYLGSPCGLVKSINFNREDQPYLRESKIQREGSLDASQLRELYSANIELYGNTLYRNGSYIYINPRLLGASTRRLRTLGLHGYYMVTAVNSTITEGGFNVSIHALAEGQEFEQDKIPAPVTFQNITAPPEPWMPNDPGVQGEPPEEEPLPGTAWFNRRVDDFQEGSEIIGTAVGDWFQRRVEAAKDQ